MVGIEGTQGSVTPSTNRASVTKENELCTLPTDYGLKIAMGSIVGTSFIHKFGEAPDFDIEDGFVSIWDGANDAGLNANIYTYSTIADIDSIVSSNTGDTQVIEVQGLDGNLLQVIQEATLAGSGYVTLGSPLKRVFRIKNQGATDFIGDVCVYVSGPTSAGIPDDASGIRACVNNGNNQTLMAVYTIPAGKTGYMDNWYATTAGARKTSVHNIHLLARPSGGVFQLKSSVSIIADGASYIQHQYKIPEKFKGGTDIEMQANTDEDVAAVSAGFDIILVDD